MAITINMSDPRVQEAIRANHLTHRQSIWAWETAVDPTISHTEAARRGGWSGGDSTLGRRGFECARNDKIIKAIEAIRAILGNEIRVTREYVLAGLQDTRQRAAEKGDLSTEVRCLELLGKTLAMFTDKSQIDDPLRQAQLDELERAEASRVAQIRLREVG